MKIVFGVMFFFYFVLIVAMLAFPFVEKKRRAKRHPKLTLHRGGKE